MQVAKWGNSLAVRIPAAVAEALKLRAGDEIEIRVAGARRFALARKPGRDELLERLRALRGRLPADFVFDRDEANEGDFFAPTSSSISSPQTRKRPTAPRRWSARAARSACSPQRSRQRRAPQDGHGLERDARIPRLAARPADRRAADAGDPRLGPRFRRALHAVDLRRDDRRRRDASGCARLWSQDMQDGMRIGEKLRVADPLK